jgi:hypothetical protein
MTQRRGGAEDRPADMAICRGHGNALAALSMVSGTAAMGLALGPPLYILKYGRWWVDAGWLAIPMFLAMGLASLSIVAGKAACKGPNQGFVWRDSATTVGLLCAAIALLTVFLLIAAAALLYMCIGGGFSTGF